MALETITIKDSANVDKPIVVDTTAAGSTQVVKLGFAPDGTDPVLVSAANPVPVTGPVTDAQLRASAVPVSGTFYQATQPVSGPLTDAQLRASVVPVTSTVTAVPADPFGANADAVVAAGAAGSIQAKLRRLTTDIDALNTNMALMVPASDIVAVTLSDASNDPNGPFRGFIYSGAGAIKVRTSAGTDITLPSGLYALNFQHSLRILRVFTTGTTATGIYGLK